MTLLVLSVVPRYGVIDKLSSTSSSSRFSAATLHGKPPIGNYAPRGRTREYCRKVLHSSTVGTERGSSTAVVPRPQVLPIVREKSTNISVNYYCTSSRVIPGGMNGWSARGRSTEPSAFCPFSRSATITRGTAHAVPFKRWGYSVRAWHFFQNIFKIEKGEQVKL